uniref:Uncharacterized protein n=1 Tax=Arundo donax TaxID=35708 RepID=A0A0A8ZUZ8_ARUDO
MCQSPCIHAHKRKLVSCPCNATDNKAYSVYCLEMGSCLMKSSKQCLRMPCKPWRQKNNYDSLH